MNLKAASTIQLCLTDIMYNVMDEKMATGLWSRLETLYLTQKTSPTSCILRNNYMTMHKGRVNGVGAFKLLQ